jgi:hypothetical protein
MKTVFSNQQLIHVWAQQTQPHGRSSGMKFEGTTLYSYQTPIANFVANKRGFQAVLITTERYSITTTTKHMPRAHDIPNSGRGGIQVFHVSHVGIEGGQSPRAEKWHAHNLTDLEKRYEAAIAKVGRSSRYWQFHHDDAHSIACTARYYCEHFGLKFPAKKFAPLSDAQIEAARAKYAKWEARNEVKLQLARENAKRIEENNRKTYEEKKALWLAGEPVHLPWVSDASTMLRVKGDEVETSRGARFPLAHGLKALPLIRAVVARGEVWRRNGKTIHLGHYQIDSIEHGAIVAGCHTIPISEVERVAASIGA